jgi:hypothetical protein
LSDSRIRQASWTGSEELRREQGICLPPTRSARKGSRFFVPAGTPCAISKVSPLGWRQYTTRKDVGFERFETYGAGVYEFRSDVGGWPMRVHRQHVLRREDNRHAV